MVEIEQEEKWPYKLLTREAHGRLVDNLPEICEQAGIRLDMIDQTMAESGCAEDEITWVKEFHESAAGGLLLHGDYTDPSGRFMAMAAAFVRNFIDARVIHIFASLNDGGFELPDPTVLLIPDLCVKTGVGGSPATAWQLRQLQSTIMDRFSKRRATIIYVETLKRLELEHGKGFYDFLMKHWDVVPEKAKGT